MAGKLPSDLRSISAFARLRGVSRASIRRWIDRGVIRRYGPDGLVSISQADRSIRKNADPAKVAAGQSKLVPPEALLTAGPGRKARGGRKARAPRVPAITFTDARLARMVAAAEGVKLTVDERREGLVDMVLVKDAVFEYVRDARASVLELPRWVAPSLAAELGCDEAKLRAVLEVMAATFLKEHPQRQVPL
jgi:hypothetical protein